MAQKISTLCIVLVAVLAACGDSEKRGPHLPPGSATGQMDASIVYPDAPVVPDVRRLDADTSVPATPDAPVDSAVVAETQPDTRAVDLYVQDAPAVDLPITQPDTRKAPVDAVLPVDVGIDTGADVTKPPLSDFTFTTWTTSSDAVSKMTISSDNSVVEWHGRSASNGEAGLNAAFAEPVDLTGYDQIWFDATIPVGQVTTVGIYKTDDDYCKWEVVGAGTTRYTVDMTSGAVYCGHTVCGIGRDSVESIYFDTGWWGEQFVTDMVLTNLGVSSTKSDTSPTSNAEGAGVGLNGWCWWLWKVVDAEPGTATSSWVETPSDVQSHFSVVDTASKGMAGTMIYLPDSLRDLSGYNSLVLTSAIQLGGGFTQFTVSLMSSTGSACSWITSPSQAENPFRLGSYDYCVEGGGVSFDIKDVEAVRIMSDYDQTGTADFNVSAISFN